MNTKGRKLDYSNQDIYCGIDVHKKSWKMTVSTVHTIGKPVSIEHPFVENVIGYLEKTSLGEDIMRPMKQDSIDFGHRRALSKAGVDTIVVNAYLVMVRN